MIHNPLKAYFLLNVELEDCALGAPLSHALRKANCVVAMTPFENPSLKELATILLPITPFSETAGTYLNIEGRLQSFKAAVKPLKNSWPAWKILSALHNKAYESAESVLKEIRYLQNFKESIYHSDHILNPDHFKLEPLQSSNDIVRLAPISLYSTDSLVRRAGALQQTMDAPKVEMRLNAKLAAHLKLEGHTASVQALTTGQAQKLRLPFIIDESVPDQCVVIPGGLIATLSLGLPYARIEIHA
jgi:NADH-quinone oxidoreductase subunit G